MGKRRIYIHNIGQIMIPHYLYQHVTSSAYHYRNAKQYDIVSMVNVALKISFSPCLFNFMLFAHFGAPFSSMMQKVARKKG